MITLHDRAVCGSHQFPLTNAGKTRSRLLHSTLFSTHYLISFILCYTDTSLIKQDDKMVVLGEEMTTDCFQACLWCTKIAFTKTSWKQIPVAQIYTHRIQAEMPISQHSVGSTNRASSWKFRKLVILPQIFSIILLLVYECALKSPEVSFELLSFNKRSTSTYNTTLTSHKTIRTSKCIEKEYIISRQRKILQAWHTYCIKVFLCWYVHQFKNSSLKRKENPSSFGCLETVSLERLCFHSNVLFFPSEKA
jgi:hypothetical protein